MNNQRSYTQLCVHLLQLSYMSQSINISQADPLSNAESPSSTINPVASLEDSLKVAHQSDQQSLDKPSISDSTFPQDENATRTGQEPNQFVALDQLRSSEPRQGLSEESAEVALMIGIESNDVIIGERLLKVIQRANFSLKVVSIIKKLTKTYWQSHKTEESNGMDKMKTFCFANMMIAAFEIKQLSEEQLKFEKEIEIFGMNEQQLYSLGVKIVKLVAIQCKIDPAKEQEEWLLAVQRFEGENAATNRRMMLASTEITQDEVDDKIQEKEVTPIKATEETATTLKVNANQETNKVELEDNYNSANCNNLSIQTEGHVTDLDISLPVLPNCEEKEPVVSIEVKTVAEGEVVSPSE